MAVTVLKNISQDEMNWYHETRYWMRISDEKTMISCAEERGHEEGLKQGLQQGIEQSAKNAIALGLSSEQIAQITGLTPEQIQRLKK